MAATSKLQMHRERLGLTQTELAARAGVSRQLIGAVEAGRNIPRVDSAIALATALVVDVGELFSEPSPPVDAITGEPPSEGATLRIGRVGEKTVTARSRIGVDGYDIADGVFVHGELERFGPSPAGPVILGCEPGLEVLERLLRESGHGGMAVMTSSRRAAEALTAGRTHAAVVHDDMGKPENSDVSAGIIRIGLARWRVGLAAPQGARPGWVEQALSGTVPVVQREPGAAVQTTFEESLDSDTSRPPGPIASTHLEAAHRAMWSGIVAVTIEPAALAVGALFHPLTTHEATIWLTQETISDPAIGATLDLINDRRFQRRLTAVGGYDLSTIGVRAA